MDIQNELVLAFEQAFGPSAIVVCLAAVGLNVHFGYTGLLNFGQAGFMAVAGYGLASMVTTWDQNFWVGIIVGILLCILLALLLGIPTLRLRADYLAIVTIAGAEIIRFVIGSSSLRETLRRPRRSAAVHQDLPATQPAQRSGRVPRTVVEPQRLLGDDRRLGTRTPLLPDDLPADAQPLGPRTQGNP